MSINADYNQAKAEFTGHVAAHGCRSRQAVLDIPREGETVCEKRIELFSAMVGTAGLLGREPDDGYRAREHYNRNAGRAAA